MSSGRMNPAVSSYLGKAKQWRAEMEALRSVLLDCPLTEELKWGKPCYVFQGKNVVLILGLKSYCTLLFCKGALLKDPNGILVKAGENTQAARHLRVAAVQDIVRMKPILKAYIEEAIDAEKNGLEVKYKKTDEFAVPEELQKKFKKSAALARAFKALTPGRQRGYLIYFAAAKQSKTRESRIEKCAPNIFEGKGWNER